MAQPSRLRAVDLLTPQQLQRKREVDRRSQRQTRERAKEYISHLEQRLEELGRRNMELEEELRTLHGRLQRNNALGMDIAIKQPASSVYNNFTVDSQINEVGADSEMQPLVFDISDMLNDDLSGINLGMWTKVLDDTMLVDCIPESSMLKNYHDYSSSLSHFQDINQSQPQAVWSVLPRHTLPRCPLDQIMVDLLQSRRTLEVNGGNNQEFERPSFPSVQSLLNPAYGATMNPVTSHIVRNIIHVMTVPSLPEQIAILYVMSKVIRWQISPTEANYDGLPEWLRPTPSQIINQHPAWLDMIPWPKVRERMCRHDKYYNEHSKMSAICNESLSINWPHEPGDMIMRIQGGDIILNPIFERHILNLKSWTVSRQILETYPSFAGEVNIGPCRGS